MQAEYHRGLVDGLRIAAKLVDKSSFKNEYPFVIDDISTKIRLVSEVINTEIDPQ